MSIIPSQRAIMSKLFFPGLLLVVVGCGTSANTNESPTSDRALSYNPDDELAAAEQVENVKMYQAELLPEGFRGGVHHFLSSQQTVEVVAEWTPTGTGRAMELGYFPPRFYQPFLDLRASERRRTYRAGQFSAFLPPDEDLDSVGRMWTVDLPKVELFLEQLDPRVATQVRSVGRLAGPDGGVALLTGSSPSHAEITFRIHAELQLKAGVFYTPAHFSGRLIVNKQKGTIEHFRLGIPQTSTLNVTLTVVLPAEALIDIVHVERMEVRTEDETSVERVEWTNRLGLTEAEAQLKQAFYKFMEIHWVPTTQAVVMAQQQDKPILAVVLWGGLDEQSC